MGHDSIMSSPMIWLGIHRQPLSSSKSTENSDENAWFPLFGRRRASAVFLLFPGIPYDVEFFCTSVLPDIESNLCDDKIRRRIEVCISISIMHQLATPNDRGKKFPERKPPGSCIRLILLMLHPMTSSCLAA
jgi:hypothetical protein